VNAPLPSSIALAPSPAWLSAYVGPRPPSDHPCALRYTALVAQALPIVAHGLAEDERRVVEDLLFIRLMLDAVEAPSGTPADIALDAWLAATVFRLNDGSAAQRCAWWRIEQLCVMRDALARHTRNRILYIDPEDHIHNQPPVADTARHWIELATHAFRHGADVGTMFELDVSEGLLDCLNAKGMHDIYSTRGAALRALRAIAKAEREARRWQK
jgi:hypothetical protein